MTGPGFRDRYFEALGIGQEDRGKDGKWQLALARAHDLRKFEIELYWKRATYFWAFQLVAFASPGFLFKDGRLLDSELLVIPSAIGAVTALAGYLTARGSRFWQENWEAHVDILEDGIEGRMTQVVLCRDPPQFSVSRTNQVLLLLLLLGWSGVLIIGGISKIAAYVGSMSPSDRGGGAILLVLLAGGWKYWRNKTKLAGRKFSVGDADWSEYRSANKGLAPFMLWRDPFGGRPPSGAASA
jgi:hypothetical protein